MKIIVGVDGSSSSTRAVEWCAAHGAAMEAEVVAVHAIEIPVYARCDRCGGSGGVPLPVVSESDRDELRDVIRRESCAPLSKANVPFSVELIDGAPAAAIMAAAEHADADLVVTGRRGRGGFAELLLGSTSHQLSHHLDRPLVIVP